MIAILQPLLLAAGQTLAIYVLLIVALSRIGRPLMAELTLVQYLIIALLGSAVETGLYVGSASLAAGLVSASTLLAANRALAFLIVRSSFLRRFLVGTAIVLVHDGQVIPSHLAQVGLSPHDLMEAIRQRGYDRLDAVRFAVQEVDGSVTVVPIDAEAGRR